jgi:hypothetical protein
MAKNSSTTIIIVVLIVFMVCCSSSSSLVVTANEFPTFGGSALDFLRGEWYTNIFGGGGSGGGGDGDGDGGGDGGGGGGGGGDGEDDNDKDGDKNKKFKNNCAYLYKDKDGKKYLISKCTDGEKTYKGSKLDGMSSIRVGKELTVYLYDKNDKKKTYEGKKDKVYNLSGNWNNDTKKMVLRHEDHKDKDENSKKTECDYDSSSSKNDKLWIFEKENYKGKCQSFGPGKHNVDWDFMGTVRSVKVPKKDEWNLITVYQKEGSSLNGGIMTFVHTDKKSLESRFRDFKSLEYKVKT